VVAVTGLVITLRSHPPNEALAMQLTAVLACLTVAAANAAPAADPPAAPATPATTAVASAPTPGVAPAAQLPPAAPAATAASTDSSDSQLEKRLRGKGYMTRMQNGQKMFCRREDQLGSRLGGVLRCMTADEARVNEEREREDLERRQRVMTSCLMSGGNRPANCGN
jgi:hypothetical protein